MGGEELWASIKVPSYYSPPPAFCFRFMTVVPRLPTRYTRADRQVHAYMLPNGRLNAVALTPKIMQPTSGLYENLPYLSHLTSETT